MTAADEPAGRGPGTEAGAGSRAGLNLVAALAALAVTLAGLALVVPGPWSGVTPVAQLVALRGLLAAVGLLGAVVGAVVSLRLRRRSRAAARAFAVLATGLTVFAATEATVLTARGTTGMLGADPAPLDGDLVVLVLNTQGSLSPEQLAAFVAARGADVVSLPETDEQTARGAAALLDADGREYQVLATTGTGSRNGTTSLLVAASLGAYQVTEAGPASSFTATGSGPTITAAHTLAPVNPALTVWRASTSWVVDACSAAPGGIAAGDLNSTLDHPMLADLGGCVDVAAQAGVAGVGTWPAQLPRSLASPIDHILVDPDTWDVVRAAVLEPPPGTDHRALEAVLDRR
ncbi:endonuclease/exonuclease/phosphatase family protein [Actinotalea sp. M2MS4P-6]|uniref:endonuclease/exonuclease/phosphatase family protein n=1 Tax=Actinotalea sp. M2MS4P-6 TaxID=2983762 RepID=UPI0021E4F49A|nr:endonuclease/exonuclease/phosphatase family protein [Actinotalea sp. M2MS4P-6]MCV2393802.1 endonuclease/exonuclease/phosphatase family protein [Actinotalea sp. M2MS4P-6]